MEEELRERNKVELRLKEIGSPNIEDDPIINLHFGFKGFDKFQSETRKHYVGERPFPKIKAFCLDSSKLDAFATRVDPPLYLIAISRGFTEILGLAFLRLLANPNVLPWIGNSEAEDFTETPLRVDKMCDLPFVLPKDPVRVSAANALTNIAFNFLLLHEKAHVFNGHVDFIADRMNTDFYSDISSFAESDERDNQKLRILRHIEMDADQYAARSTANALSGKLKDDLLPHFKTILTGCNAEVLAAIDLSLRTLWSLLPSSDDSNWRQYPHPPITFRMLHVQAEIAKTLFGFDLSKLETALEELSDYFSVMNSVFGCPPFPLAETSKELNEELAKTYQETNTDLSSFAYPFKPGGTVVSTSRDEIFVKSYPSIKQF